MDCGTLISHLQLTWKALDRRTGGSYFNDFTREVPDQGGAREDQHSNKFRGFVKVETPDSVARKIVVKSPVLAFTLQVREYLSPPLFGN